MCAKYPQLQQEYPNQWIAMNEDGVVAFGESHDAVMAAVRERGMHMSDVALEYIDSEDSALVLLYRATSPYVIDPTSLVACT